MALLDVVHALWRASLAPAALRFARAQADPIGAQARLLRRRLAANAGSAYGRAHGFDRIGTPAEYQRRAPIVTYDALAPWLARARAGEPNVLTTEPVRLFERSGGTTGAATKLIPYTPALLADFAAATNPWLFDMYRRHRLAGTRAYWSLSPVAQGARATEGGVPIGIDDDTAYFGPVRRRALALTMAVPPDIAKVTDFVTWRRRTLVALLACEDLGLVSVWSPTFMVVLLQALEADRDAVLAALPPGRAAVVARALDAGPDRRPIWPRLALISCWADGPAAGHLAPLRRAFPGVVIQPKGLLATEGVVSVPVGDGPGAALALTSHVLELIDLDHPTRPTVAPWHLRIGASYSPVLTTGGGLYRYHLPDVVRCVAPLRVRFEGKLDQVADVAGEKLHARGVERALEVAGAELGVALDFALLAPIEVAGRASYCLYLEAGADDGALARVAARVERELREGHAYRYCRDLGQLGPLRWQRVSDGRERALRALVASGRRAGDIKPSVLETRADCPWAEVFGMGKALDESEGA